MMTADDRTALASIWRATPGDYSSIRSLHFKADGTGELAYAYGQSIYAIIPCTWDMPSAGRLRLTYSAPIKGKLAATFVLSDENRVKELSYTLTEGRVAGVETVVGTPYEFNLTLELSESPWPSGMDLPYTVPRVFWGTSPKREH